MQHLGSTIRRLLADRSGQEFVEYALAVGAVALVALAAISVVARQQGEQVAIGVAVSPGQHPTDNGPWRAGDLVEVHENDAGTVSLDFDTITGNNNGFNSRLSDQLDVGGFAPELEQHVIPVYPN